MDYEYEIDHPIWYRSDAEQMLRDGIIDEEDLKDAEIIDDPEHEDTTPNATCKGCGNPYYLPSQPEDEGDLYCDKCLREDNE